VQTDASVPSLRELLAVVRRGETASIYRISGRRPFCTRNTLALLSRNSTCFRRRRRPLPSNAEAPLVGVRAQRACGIQDEHGNGHLVNARMIFAEMWRKKMLAMNESDRTRTINGSLNEDSARQCGIDESSEASRCCIWSREVRGWMTRATETQGRKRRKEQESRGRRLLTRGDRASRRCTVSAWCWSCRRRQPRGKNSACSRSCLLHDGLHTKKTAG
jgi:hypothetical protein